MAHHYSGPDFGFPRGDARLDLTDLFAFPSPNNPGRSILILDAHPSVGVNPSSPTTTVPFSPEARYEIQIDTNGDVLPDITYRVTFAGGSTQTATVHRIAGPHSDGGEVIVERLPVSTGREAHIAEGRGHRVFAGWRSDPFFFDVAGAIAGLKFTGTDYFAEKDVCSIVLDVPNAALGSGTLGLWMRALVPGEGGWIQVERGGRPQLAVFLAGEARDAYQAAEPSGDARFVPAFAHALEHAGGYAPDVAGRLATQLLPDILHYDPARPASYPANGRSLTDRVVRYFLPILTNGKVMDDNVDPHTDLLDDFPYVGPPHRA